MSTFLYQRNSGVDTSAVGDRIIVFERATRRAIVLNPTGAQLWQWLEAPRSQEQLTRALQDEFPAVPAAQIAADVEVYLSELRQQNLVVAA